MASTGRTIMKRPSNIAIPIDVLYHRVFPLNPPKADPSIRHGRGEGIKHLAKNRVVLRWKWPMYQSHTELKSQ